MASIIGKTILRKYEWHRASQGTSQQPTRTATGTGSTDSPVTLSFCHTLRRDQLAVIDHLNRGRDVFQLVSPGGGKTLPVLCWWVANCIGIDVMNPQNYRVNLGALRKLLEYQKIPKLVWCVPTRQLNARFAEEFKEPMVKLINSVISNLLKVYPGNIIPILLFLGVKDPRLKLKEIEELRKLFEQTNNIVYRQQADTKQANLDSEIIEAISRWCDKLITMAMEGVKPDLNAAIIIGIYESIATKIKEIKNVKLIVLDESHKMFPADMKSLESALEREFNIADAVFEIVKNSQNARIVFLSGTVNPSTVDNLLTVINVCFNRNFVVHRSAARNPAKLELVRDDQLKDPNYLMNLAVYKISKRDWGNLIVLFSKKQIESLCRQINEKLVNAAFSPRVDMYSKQINKKSLTDEVLKQPEISQIENPTLREYATKGFGFITSDVSPNDQAIIGTLFANKQLAVLITTDSVEVGVNLAVKDLYIPSLNVFRGEEFRDLPLPNINQLINRAGRSAIDRATIHTTSEYYNLIEASLILNPEQYEEVPVLMTKKLSNIECRKKLALYYAKMKLQRFPNFTKELSKKVLEKIVKLMK